MTNIDPYELEIGPFMTELAKRTTPDELFANAHNVYDYLSELFGCDCNDSLLREWSFQWWEEETGKHYDEIHYRWLYKGQPRPETEPFYDNCQIEQVSQDGEDDGLTWFHCNYHNQDTLNEFSCQ